MSTSDMAMNGRWLLINLINVPESYLVPAKCQPTKEGVGEHPKCYHERFGC